MTEERKQVSEVSNLEDAGEIEAPGDATAGYPDSESGDAQEGTAGPNAAPATTRRSRRTTRRSERAADRLSRPGRPRPGTTAPSGPGSRRSAR